MNKLKMPGSGSRKDVMVSVRLPKSLVDELRDLQKINHFIDLSDEIRFIVRRYCLGFLNAPSKAQPPIEQIAEQKRKEKLIDDLSKIIEGLKGKSSQESEQKEGRSNE